LHGRAGFHARGDIAERQLSRVSAIDRKVHKRRNGGGSASQARRLLAASAELFSARGAPANIRSDNDSEFLAASAQKWLAQVGVKTLKIGQSEKRRWEPAIVDQNRTLLRRIHNDRFQDAAPGRVTAETRAHSSR
jgi:hypothetical protein